MSERPQTMATKLRGSPPHKKLAPPEQSRRRINSRACEKCRKKRTKCSGHFPCDPCVKAGIECKANAEHDRRSKEARKRALGEIAQPPKKALAKVINLLRKGDETDLNSLMGIIENGPSVDEFIQYLLDQSSQDEERANPPASTGTQTQEQIWPIGKSQPHNIAPARPLTWNRAGKSSISGTRQQPAERGARDSNLQMSPQSISTLILEDVSDMDLWDPLPLEEEIYNASLESQRYAESPGWHNIKADLTSASSPSRSDISNRSMTAYPWATRRDPSFLSPLFKREEGLLNFTIGSEQEAGEEAPATVDPKLLQKNPPRDDFPTISETPRTCGTRVPRKNRVNRDPIGPLHAHQNIIETLSIHPNFQNLFSNLPFSNSVWTNGHPPSIQSSQVRNLFIPTWAMMTVNTKPDPGNLQDIFTGIYDEASMLLQNGTSLREIVGVHPNIAALFNENEFNKSSLLSRWAARMVHSLKREGYNFTCFASMYVFWYVMRWMIYPSPETYEEMPDWIRPMPNQLFMPHINFIDFIIWPAFRELAVKFPSTQQRMQCLLDLSINIRCDWPYPIEDALAQNVYTGETDLTKQAKECMLTLANWSAGHTFRSFVPNADAYVNIRDEE